MSDQEAIVGICTGSGTHRMKESTLLACLRCGLWQLEGEYAQYIDALGLPEIDPDDPEPGGPPPDAIPELDRLIDEMKRIEEAIAFIEPPKPDEEMPF